MVYHGSNGPYSEEDESSPVPTMVYGVSKKRGEENLLSQTRATVVRSALVIGRPPVSGKGRGSTLEWMKGAIEKATAESPAKFFSNELRSPVLVDDIVRVIATIIQKNSELEAPLVLNMGGASFASRYDLGAGLAKRMNLGMERIQASLQEPISGGIERPRDIRMKIDKLRKTLGIEMCTLDESLDFIFGIAPHPYLKS
jgi:dTDP-4-dehydrorhamnose reductase